MVKQRELEAIVLLALYNYFQRHSESLSLQEVTGLLRIDVPDARVGLALGVLQESLFVASSRVIVSGQVVKYWLTDDGYKYAEELHDRAENNQASDPLAAIEAKLAPASDRVVSFAHNQEVKEEVLSTIEQAEEMIRASNELDEEVKSQTLLSVKSGRDFMESAKSFAIGVFKHLVWDRLKAVAKSAIEEVYKIGLTALLMTLGALIVGLI